MRTQDDELEGPVIDDLPLIAIAFLTMGIFTALAFGRIGRRDKGSRCVQSSSLLGFGATVTVLLSMLTGYGICSLAGYPITSLTQALPFVLVGIGLDDSFIIFGALQQLTKDKRENADLRIIAIALASGPSIAVTTLTDCMAFAVGAAFSSIPGIRWFCFYAVVCILIDFLYQITFFIALLELDLRRQDSNCYDCLVCIRAKEGSAAPKKNADTTSDSGDEEPPGPQRSSIKQDDHSRAQAPRKDTWKDEEDNFQSKIMRKYARFLFKPTTKILVLVTFIGLIVVLGLSALQIETSFDLTDYMGDGSVIAAYMEADELYFAEVGAGLTAFVYYQGLDQSSSEVQAQMLDFVHDLAEFTEFVDDELPTNVWFHDLEQFVSNHNDLEELSFEEQVDAFLSVSPYHTLYGRNIVRDDDGRVVASRTQVTLNVDQYDAIEQVRLLQMQRDVTEREPLNKHKQQSEMKATPGDDDVDRLFMFHPDFPTYFHYQIIPKELQTTLIVQLAAVAIVSMLFFSHPTGTFLSVTVVAMVDVELMGIIPLAGFTLNSVTFLLLVMAIGLVVDYCMHIIDAYLKLPPQEFSDRNEHMEAALVDIGASVFLGGFSTFLGILALAFASGEIFRTFFVMFVSMVVLGVAYALVFIPVVLSLIGPTTTGTMGNSGAPLISEETLEDEADYCSNVGQTTKFEI